MELKDIETRYCKKIDKEAATALMRREGLVRPNTVVDLGSYGFHLSEDGERIPDKSGTWYLSIFGNEIVRLRPDNSVSVCAGGLGEITVTTKRRISPFCNVWHSKKICYLEGARWDNPNTWVCVDRLRELRLITNLSEQLATLRALANNASLPQLGNVFEQLALARWCVNLWAPQSPDGGVIRDYVSQHCGL
jgi:hypothetical protein